MIMEMITDGKFRQISPMEMLEFEHLPENAAIYVDGEITYIIYPCVVGLAVLRYTPSKDGSYDTCHQFVEGQWQ